MTLLTILLIIFFILTFFVIIVKIATRNRNQGFSSYQNSSGGLMSKLKDFGAECCNKLKGKNHGI